MKQIGNPILVGLIAGVVAAALYASVVTGSAAGLLLFFIAPLPAFIAGLGWGVSAALAAVASGCLLTVLLLGPLGALLFAVAVTIPAALLTHFAFLYRESPQSTEAGETIEDEIQWYPVGHLLLILVIVAGTLAAISVLVLGTSYDAYMSTVGGDIDTMVKQGTEAGVFKPMSADDLARYKTIMAAMLPASTALLLLLLAMLNLWLGGQIVRLSGQLRRPWPDLAAMRLHPAAPLAFLALLAASLAFDGLPGLLVSGYAAALALALVVVGLAIAHYVSRGHPLRGLFLFATYAAAILVGWGALILLVVGLLDPLMDFRKQKAGGLP